MESDFTKKRKKEIKECRNELIIEIMIYAAAVVLMFMHGGRLAELITMKTSTVMLYDTVVKIYSFLYFLFLTAIIFIPGPLYLINDIRMYLVLRNSLW
jgi:hypothetical protein